MKTNERKPKGYREQQMVALIDSPNFKPMNKPAAEKAAGVCAYDRKNWDALFDKHANWHYNRPTKLITTDKTNQVASQPVSPDNRLVNMLTLRELLVADKQLRQKIASHKSNKVWESSCDPIILYELVYEVLLNTAGKVQKTRFWNESRTVSRRSKKYQPAKNGKEAQGAKPYRQGFASAFSLLEAEGLVTCTGGRYEGTVTPIK